MQAHEGCPPGSPLMSTEFEDNCLPALADLCGLIRGPIDATVQEAYEEVQGWKGWKADIEDRYTSSLHQLETLEQKIQETQAKVPRTRSYPGMGLETVELLKEAVAVQRRQVNANRQASRRTSLAPRHLGQLEEVLTTLTKLLADVEFLETDIAASIQSQSQIVPSSVARHEVDASTRLTHHLATGQPQDSKPCAELKLRICTCTLPAVCGFFPAQCPSFCTLHDVFITGEEQQLSSPVTNTLVSHPWQTVTGFVLTGPMTERMRMSLTGAFLRSTVKNLPMLQYLEFDLGQEDANDGNITTDDLHNFTLPHLRFITTRFSHLGSRLDFMADLDVPDIQQVTLLTFPRRVCHQSRGWEVLTDFIMFNNHLPSLRIREFRSGAGGECSDPDGEYSVAALSALLRNPVQLE